MAHEGLNLNLMNVLIVNLYDFMKKNTFIQKLSEGFKLPCSTSSREDYPIKLNKSLYWLKQSRCM